MQSKRSFSPEIQGLRAVAVGLVVLFHIWPSVISGGYVGVDVFFVISGYLITGLLARMALRDGRISLAEFYSRRVRRLLPAATLVLVACAIGTLLIIPQSRWQETAQQIGASALYIQNWVLAWLSVDYLGAEQAPSPVQHYWSLSIEEQFYVVWPLLMIVLTMLSRRFAFSMRRGFVAGLACIFTLSLAASIWITATDPARAYFVTHTRMWELALGGLLALTIHRFAAGPRLRAGLSALGLIAILCSALFYTPKTAFPGYAALLPTLGTLLIILAGDVRWGIFRGVNLPVLRYIGDRSYSIYLWHWPLVIFYSIYDDTIGPVDGTALIALTLVISHLSYRFVEEPFRHPRHPKELRPLAYGFASIAACVLAAAAIQFTASAEADVKVAAGDPRYPGPAALLSGAPVPEGVTPIPPLAGLKHDLPVIYERGCHQNQEKVEPIHCVFGPEDATKVVAIIGDSHAAQWLPALQRIGEPLGWRIVTFTKSACAFARVDVKHSGVPYPSCSEWRENAIREIVKLRPDIVFTSESRYRYIADTAMIEGIRSTWKAFVGSQVIAIHDTPWVPFDAGDCVSHPSTRCKAERKKVEARDLFRRAAKGMKNVEVVDMIDGICGAKLCLPVVGNMIVWRDHNHLTATYAAALAPYLAEAIGLSASTVEPVRKPALVAKLHCSALKSGHEINRALPLERDGDTLTYRHGDWRRRKENYDLWNGTVTDGKLTFSGHYREGNGGVKDVSLAGTLKDGELSLAGKRGPRDCTLTATLPSGPPA